MLPIARVCHSPLHAFKHLDAVLTRLKAIFLCEIEVVAQSIRAQRWRPGNYCVRLKK